MSSMQPGWYPDPFGRFARRYHDGRSWTEHVADQQGTQLSDAAPVSGQAPPPAQGAPAAGGWQQPAAQTYQPPQQPAAPGGAWGQPSAGAGYGQPGQQGWGQTATGYAAPRAAGASTGIGAFLGVIIAGVGALLVFIGLFGLDWAKVNGFSGNRGDVADFIDSIKDQGGDPNILSTTFFGWAWILAILVALAVVAAALMKPTPLRIAGAAAAGVMFLWILFGWLNLNAYIDSNKEALGVQEHSLQIGGWVTLLGFIALGVGAFIGGQLGAPKRSGPAGPTY